LFSKSREESSAVVDILFSRAREESGAVVDILFSRAESRVVPLLTLKNTVNHKWSCILSSKAREESGAFVDSENTAENGHVSCSAGLESRVVPLLIS